LTGRAEQAGLAPAALLHLEGRHGTETAEVLALCAADPTLGQPLVPGLAYLRAEAVWAARREMAHTLTDVLARRTRALILDREAAAEAAPAVAALLAPELGWDATEQARQLAEFERVVDVQRTALRTAERRAGATPDPAAAGAGTATQ
jgi:glycerol-3-phosphate dehydrogenase